MPAAGRPTSLAPGAVGETTPGVTRATGGEGPASAQNSPADPVSLRTTDEEQTNIRRGLPRGQVDSDVALRELISPGGAHEGIGNRCGQAAACSPCTP
eukprot:7429889-Pyramimonas_sp.AAC.1